MKKEPLVSVLLSIYKVEDYLEECLDSIINQSYKNLEIVCVDNGSPDRCGEILAEYAQKDKRIKVITLKENKMVCGGRNAGLDNATGDFICFVDPDDWIEENHIKAMVDTIMTKKDPDGNPLNLVLNSALISFVNDTNKVIEVRNFKSGLFSIKDYNKNIFLEIAIPMWGRLYRKKFIDKHNVRFLEGMHTDNIPFTTKLLAHMNYWYIISNDDMKKSAYHYRLITMEGSITPIISLRSLELPDCLENLYDYFCKFKYNKKIKVMYYEFFTSYFPRHEDQPRYYTKFKKLMQKMENDIKSSGLYTSNEINLCNLLLYTTSPFDFIDRYYNKQIIPDNKVKFKFLLFDKISLFSVKGNKNKKISYKFLGLTIWKLKYKKNSTRAYLFGCLPIYKKISK